MKKKKRYENHFPDDFGDLLNEIIFGEKRQE